jgi:type II secretory pathway pseudopilin PulG
MTAAEMAAAATVAATTVTSASTAAVTSAATSAESCAREQRRQDKDRNSDGRFGHGTLPAPRRGCCGTGKTPMERQKFHSRSRRARLERADRRAGKAIS